MFYVCVLLLIFVHQIHSSTPVTVEFSGASFSDWKVKVNGGSEQDDPPIEVCLGDTVMITKTSTTGSHPLKIVEGDLGFTAAKSASAITNGNVGTGTTSAPVVIQPSVETTYTYICTIHQNMIGKIKFKSEYCSAPATTPTCASYTCLGTGKVLKQNPSGIDCTGTCDDSTCCESGYYFGNVDISLCPDDSPIQIVWQGNHNIQETVSNDCSSDIRAGALPFNFAGTTTLNGDEGFLGDGKREYISADRLSEWGSTRYFRCTQHCSGARLRVTCNKLGTCSVDRQYDDTVDACAEGRVTEKCRCAKGCELDEYMALPGDTCNHSRDPIWKQKEQTCSEAGISFCPEGVKSSASNLYCEGMTCAGSADREKCCATTDTASSGGTSTCASHSCPTATHVSKSDPSGITCSGTFCSDAECCDAKATCDTLDCGSDSVLKPSPESIPCAGSSCDLSVDKTECCDAKATCDSFTCEGNYVNEITNDDEYCAGSKCNAANDTSTCCVEKAKCDSKTESELCETGYVFKTGYESTHCQGTECYHSTDRDTCCEILLPNCKHFKCHVDFTLRANPEIIMCASSVCDKRDDLYTCCESSTPPYNRGKPEAGLNNCHDENCKGIGAGKCVDSNFKVTQKCECHETITDGITKQIEIGEYCDPFGFYMSPRASGARDMEKYARVVSVKGVNNEDYGCADECQDLFEAKDTDKKRFVRGGTALGITGRYGLKVCQNKKECSLCPICTDQADQADFGYRPTIGREPRPEGEDDVFAGGCELWCEASYYNCQPSNTNPNAVCAGHAADGSDLSTSFRDRIARKGWNEEQIQDNVCSWKRCNGCTICQNRAKDETTFNKFRSYGNINDVFGDGSDYRGGCSKFCAKHFHACKGEAGYPCYGKRNSASNTALYDRWSDKKRKNNICSWRTCSGCKACLEWAEPVPGEDINKAFRYREAREDYSRGDIRQKMPLYGKCDNQYCAPLFKASTCDHNCKVEVCESYECNGCAACTLYLESIENALAATIDVERSQRKEKTAYVDKFEAFGMRKGGCAGPRYCKSVSDCSKVICQSCGMCSI